MKTRIIIDSTADMTPEIKSRVYTVPLTVHFGREEYIDGVTIDHKTFYEKLIESDVLPTTSQATPSAFAQEYERARQAGEAAVVITLASKFSGTYQSAVIAAADYENVYVVDGASAAMGTGILVELAFRLLDGGMSAKEIAETLETEKKKIVVVALVDTLEYLKRGGRISATTAVVGSMLQIKPVLHVDDEGHLINIGKARGRQSSLKALVDKMEKTVTEAGKQTVFISHGDCLEDAEAVAQMVRERFGTQDIRINYVGPVIGAHSGPGTLALFYLGTQR